jgi:hypothetical protein
MPYDNSLNRQIAEKMQQILKEQINNTPLTYEIADGMVGYANKKLLDDNNIEQEENKLEQLEEGLPESNELEGGSLGSVGGFAHGTWRDTGYGKTKGAGKNKIKIIDEEKNEKPKKNKVEHKKEIKEEKELLLMRNLEGGKRKKKTPTCSDVGILNKNVIGEGKKKRGRPLKMIGGTDLGEPHNMVKSDGTTGNGKPCRTIGGRKLTPVANMQSSGMAGQGKNKKEKEIEPQGTKRSDIVKKIMKERGVNMIKASSIVKNENLFVKKGTKK